MELIKTSEKIAVEDYPYGFTMRTTLFDEIEFSPKKGYRHVKTTVNPKTGKLNKPKKFTYSDLLVRYYGEEDGHIKVMGFSFNGCNEINKAAKFISENFESFTPAEIKYFYTSLHVFARVDFQATWLYCGSKKEDIDGFYRPFLGICKQGIEDGSNRFDTLVLDKATIDATKDVNYNPFTVSEYRIG